MRAARALLALALVGATSAPDPFAPLTIYPGEWRVLAKTPWSGAKPGSEDRISSRCTRYTAYYACEQSLNGKPLVFIVYTVGEKPATFNTRFVNPDGRAEK